MKVLSGRLGDDSRERCQHLGGRRVSRSTYSDTRPELEWNAPTSLERSQQISIALEVSDSIS